MLKRSTLEALAEIVHRDHCDRLDLPFAEKLVPRPFKPRPRPKTAIISEAVRRKLA